MCLDVAHRTRIDPSLAVGGDQQVGLCSVVRSGERTGSPAMVFGTGADHAINMVTRLLCIGEFFQHEYTNPFASHIAIGLRREGFAASILTQHACFAETDMHFGRDQGIDATDNSHSALTTLDRIHPPVNGHQGTGACCLNRLAGSVQVEKIAHATRSHRRCQTSGRIAFNRYTGTR